MSEKCLLDQWRDMAYDRNLSKEQLESFWGKYFTIETSIYEQLLDDPDTEVKGTVKELAEKYGQDVMTMVGFLDGINDSLKTPNPIETMDEDTEVSLGFDKEKLYKNMASYITPLPQDGLFSLRSAILQPFLSARLTATSAPLEYSAVTFLPLQLTTAPPRRSLGSRGVGKPPAVSGQTGMSRYFSRSAAIFSAAIALCPPLYLHSTPSRHALISSASFSLIAPTSSCSAP